MGKALKSLATCSECGHLFNLSGRLRASGETRCFKCREKKPSNREYVTIEKKELLLLHDLVMATFRYDKDPDENRAVELMGSFDKIMDFYAGEDDVKPISKSRKLTLVK